MSNNFSIFITSILRVIVFEWNLNISGFAVIPCMSDVGADIGWCDVVPFVRYIEIHPLCNAWGLVLKVPVADRIHRDK